MIDPNELPKIVAPYVEALKAQKPHEPVKYTERYNYARDQAKEIGVHAMGKFPDKLIRGRAPSESEAEFDYRKHAYQPVTKAPWARLNNATESVWHGVTVTTEDENLMDYLGDGYPEYSGVVEWFREVASPKKTQDPNAVVWVTLKEEPESDADLVRPVMRLTGSYDVVEFTDAYFLGITSRKVPITYGNSTKKEGIEFVVIDDVAEYRFTQVGKKVDWEFQITYEYRHGLDHTPAYQLKGIPHDLGGEVAWESLFYNAVPYLNKAAVEASTLDAIVYRHGFPTRVYYDEDCDEPSCDGGYITTDGHKETCGACKGTGKRAGFTWGADYTHRPPGRLDSELQPDFPGLTYVAPPPEPMEFLDKRVNSLIESAGHAVNFDLTRPTSKPVTATEKGIDLQEQYKVLFKFASSMYDTLEYVVWDIAKLRYPRADIDFTVNRRADFSIRSAEMLIEEYSQYQKSGLPQFMGATIIRGQAKMRFNSDPTMMRMLDVLEFCDGLHGYATSDAIALGARFQPWQLVLHFQFDALVNQAQAEDARFLERDLPDIKADLTRRAQALTQSSGGAQSIIEGLA